MPNQEILPLSPINRAGVVSNSLDLWSTDISGNELLSLCIGQSYFYPSAIIGCKTTSLYGSYPFNLARRADEIQSKSTLWYCQNESVINSFATQLTIDSIPIKLPVIDFVGKPV